MSRPGFVYLIAADNGLTKIGRSKNPQRRLRELSNNDSLALLHQIQTDDMAWLEGYLHGRFFAARCGGEWFRLSEHDIAPLLSVHRWDRPEVVAEQSTVRIDTDLAEMLAIIARVTGASISDMVSPILRPHVQRRYEEALVVLNKRGKATKDG